MKANIASITAILFLASTLVIYWGNFRNKFRVLGIGPLLANCSFYILLLVSILYSDSLFVGFKALQASLLILFFPLVVFYFLPKVEEKTMELFSYGFIISNFILLLYFFNVLVEGLAIDRFPGLTEAGLFDQLSALNKYPYEFVLSKAEKHLELIYESHKVYLSIHFLVAVLLAVRLIFRNRIGTIRKILLTLLIVIFSIPIVYSQSLTSVMTLVLLLATFPFLYVKKRQIKLIYVFLFLGSVFFSWKAGVLKTYENKNTASIVKLFDLVMNPNAYEAGIDKRIYIYKCSINLITDKLLFGYGVGDVQNKLNQCYNQNGYVISEFKAVGSEINSHNYYLNVWLAGGVLAFLALLWFFFHNARVAITDKDFAYFFFLIVFAIGLMTENILVRMAGVFLFAIVNSLFYSLSTTNGSRE